MGQRQELTVTPPEPVRPLLAAGAQAWTWLQLEPGDMHVTSTMRRVAGLAIRECRADRTSIHRLRPLPRHQLLIVGTTHQKLFAGGHELGADRCLVVDDTAEAELIAHAGSAWLTISAPTAVTGRACLRGTVLSPGVRLGFDPGEEVMSGSLRAFAPLMDVSQRAAASADDRRANRRRAIERAREFIRDHLGDPLRLADICAHARLGARSLEYGFRELVRTSPMGYVRMLRLGEVRRLLLDRAAATRSISSIAMDTGFSHISQFILDYRRVFGETPSTTRRNAHDHNPDLPEPPTSPHRPAGVPRAPYCSRASCASTPV